MRGGHFGVEVEDVTLQHLRSEEKTCSIVERLLLALAKPMIPFASRS